MAPTQCRHMPIGVRISVQIRSDVQPDAVGSAHGHEMSMVTPWCRDQCVTTADQRTAKYTRLPGLLGVVTVNR